MRNLVLHFQDFRLARDQNLISFKIFGKNDLSGIYLLKKCHETTIFSYKIEKVM